MKINKQWTLFYAKNASFKGVEKYNTYSFFENVNLPTLFEMQLYKNKILGHPYYSTNNWDYQKYEDYHQIYVRHFKATKKVLYLKLNGIDTIANIYLNGRLIGKTNNAFLKYTYRLTNLEEENELIIHIHPCVLEGKKFDVSHLFATQFTYEALYIRKPSSSFGWDILPRTPLGGIFDDVELLNKIDIVESIFVKPEFVSKEKATISFEIETDAKNLFYEIKGTCEESTFEVSGKSDLKIDIYQPKLWNIRGYGAPNLYNIIINVYKNDKLVEKHNIRYGIRKVELKRSSIVEENGKFEFYINDQKVFLLGSNWVPTDAIKHYDNKRAFKALEMLEDLNCNAIRMWGGGIYETDEFFNYCDEHGFFIWQDFMMACASYPQDEYFVKLLKEEATYTIKRLRNHACLCLWAGDNENDVCNLNWKKPGTDPNENILTRKVLPEAINLLDGTRPYLPSSPYIDEYALKNKDKQLAEDHLWGPRDYFKGEYYRVVNPYFASETGYHALNSVPSLKKFLKHPWPLFDKEGKPTKEYLCHAVSVIDSYDSVYAYRIKLMADQVKTLFKDEITNVKDFSLASQISQGEAMKYFIEKMRKDPIRNGGIIWWNILDGWPQISDAIVDYYFDKKKAYYYIKRSQYTNIFMMDEEEDKLNLICVSSSLDAHTFTYKVINAYTDEILVSGNAKTFGISSTVIGSFKRNENKDFYIIEYCDEKGKKYINHFHTNVINLDFKKYVEVCQKYHLFED